MFLDIENQLMKAQLVSAATVVSADSYDLLVVGHDPSIGTLLAGYVVPTISAAGGATYTVNVIQATNAALTAGVSVVASAAVAANAFLVDIPVIIPIPQGSITKQYLGFQLVPVGGAAPTVTLSASIVPQEEIAKNPNFPRAYVTI